jgi:hypothetical protein
MNSGFSSLTTRLKKSASNIYFSGISESKLISLIFSKENSRNSGRKYSITAFSNEKYDIRLSYY